MSVLIKNGDLLESDCEYICHQVNCQGRMGSGIAKQIRVKWPAVYIYYKDYCDSIWNKNELQGNIQIISINEQQNVINMFAQLNYGYDGAHYTSYKAFEKCLQKIKNNIPKGSKIGFPYKIGCGLGGGNWNIVYDFIKEELEQDYEVEIYKLED